MSKMPAIDNNYIFIRLKVKYKGLDIFPIKVSTFPNFPYSFHKMTALARDKRYSNRRMKV